MIDRTLYPDNPIHKGKITIRNTDYTYIREVPYSSNYEIHFRGWESISGLIRELVKLKEDMKNLDKFHKEHHGHTQFNMVDPSPGYILNYIYDNFSRFRDYTFVILGKVGPTGKTTMCRDLQLMGLNAYEITDMIYNSIYYTEERPRNQFIEDDINKTAVIILNRSVERKD